MPLENWIQNYAVARFLYDWQTLIAGLLAVLAAWRTIRATVKSANREVAASQAQTVVAEKQIETTVRLEQDRVATEARAFLVMLEAAMVRVIAEAAWARKNYPSFMNEDAGQSPQARIVRNSITRGAFAELRGACVRQGSRLTGEFLDLEREIDSFARQWVDVYEENRKSRQGQHAGLSGQLKSIEDKATLLRNTTREILGLNVAGSGPNTPAFSEGRRIDGTPRA